jgi:spore maturation protein A
VLNYIWAGLIVFSFVFALVNDLRDLATDRYRNVRPMTLTIEPPAAAPAAAHGSTRVTVRIDAAAYKDHYGVDEPVAASYAATMVTTDRGRELQFPADATLPPTLAAVRDATNPPDTKSLFRDPGKSKSLLARVTRYEPIPGSPAYVAAVEFQPVRWVKMQAIGNAAMTLATTAIELSLGLIGTLCVFLGVMQIAEKAGIINAVVYVTGPILRPLFPGIPKGHPAMGMVTLNLTANMLGLGNAATPFGIKAMEELQKLNRSTDTATNSMVMLLAMNTAGVQILPPVFLYAVMGLRASELYFPILVVTGLALIVAIASVKLLGKLPGYRASDPDLLPPPPTAEVA